MDKNNIKTKCKLGMNFIFLRFMEVWTQLLPCKVNVTPFGGHLLWQIARDPLRSITETSQYSFGNFCKLSLYNCFMPI